MCVSVKWLRPVTPKVAQETIAPAATHQAQALHLPLCFSCVWKNSYWTTTIQQVFTPPKFNISPLKIDGWKITFLFGNVTFQGLC